MGRSELRIFLLGRFRVVADGREVDPGAWRLRKAQSLVKLLALSPGFRLHREQVLEALWPDLDPAAATNNLHQVVHAARRALEPELGRQQPSRYLVLQSDSFALAAPGGVYVDAVAFEALADDRRSLGDDALEGAARIYAGDLLPDEPFEDWVIRRRERLREFHLAVLLEISTRREGRGDLPGAIQTYERIAAADPAREPAQAALIRLYAANGDRRRALHQYDVLRRALREEIGVEPESATQTLYESIRHGAPDGGLAAADTGNAAVARRPGSRDAVRPSQPGRQQAPPVGAGPGNLPIPLTSFVGRQYEAAHLSDLLREHRLVTATGPGGAGKSRLAAHVAGGVRSGFRDGAWLVDVDTLLEPEQLVPRVAESLRLAAVSGDQAAQIVSVVHRLRPRQALLVLDGCEHLTRTCATFCREVLTACPEVRIIATSRQPLGVPGEIAWTVPPLTVPAGDSALTGEEWEEFDAVRLFVERARAQRPGFALAPGNAATVADICRRLDGLPLAIELAAARMRVLSLQQIADRLARRFDLLTGGAGAAPARQQTLLATMEWSYDLLSSREQVLFRRLAVLEGPWLLDEAERVCAGDGIAPAEVVDLLSGLVDKSLVMADDPATGPPSFRMLETVRDFAWQELVGSGEAEPLVERARRAADSK